MDCFGKITNNNKVLRASLARAAACLWRVRCMGVGEDALRAHLAREGWSLKPGVLGHFGKRADLASARKALLDADLGRVGEPIVRAADKYLTGPMVLQVVAVTDVSRPKTRPGDSEVSQANSTSQIPRMLRVELTDGDARFVGVEHSLLTAVTRGEDDLPTGSKVLVPAGVRVELRLGVLLFEEKNVIPLGGKVSSLCEDWERRRRYAETQNESSDNWESSVAASAPKFEPYDPHDTVAIKAAASKRQAEATRVVNEAAAAATAAASAKAAKETDRTAPGAEDDAEAFVPRARPTLPPTRAQRAAAAASGAAVPTPFSVPVNHDKQDTHKTERPALPPKKTNSTNKEQATPSPLVSPPDAAAKRRERLLERRVEPRGPSPMEDDRGGRGGRGDRGVRGGRGRRRGDAPEEEVDKNLTFEQHALRRGRGDADASEALARQLHRKLNVVHAPSDASRDLAAALFAFPAPKVDSDGDRGDRSGRGKRAR